VGAVALAALAIGPFAKTSGRLLAACPKWVSLAAGLELLSMLGFVVVFALVFGARSGRLVGLGAGLRALGAITVLPAGGAVGPGLAVRTSCPEPTSVRSLARSTVALTILTNAPEVLVLWLLSVSLWLGWPTGPHDALRTLPAAGGAAATAGAVALLGRARGSARRSSPRSRRGSGLRRVSSGLAVIGDGAVEARALLSAHSWRLAGAVAYYAFDNAVLWAAFHAYGDAPALSVIVMGYLVGSLGTLLPLPAGIGAVEGGLFGALVIYGAPAAPAAGAVLLYRGVSISLPVLLSALAWMPRPAAGPRGTPAGRVTRSPRGAGGRGALSTRMTERRRKSRSRQAGWPR
jgi:uncharacterized membrane protein YbhN (UPF0104 family)